RAAHLLAAFGALLAVAASCGGGGDGSPPPTQRPAFDDQRAFADLEAQVRMGPRAPGTQGHDDVVTFITNALNQYADQVTAQQFQQSTELGPPGHLYDFTNIIGEFNGITASEVLAVSAHFDTRPKADNDPDPAKRGDPVPGANDGASGVAVLLEIARALKAQTPPRSVLLIFFDAEDSGLSSAPPPYYGFCLGSQYLAANMGALRIDKLILLDMIGDASLGIPKEINSRNAAPQLLDDVFSTARDLGHTAFEDRTGSAVIDDHLPFIASGIRAIDLIDFAYPYWHTTSDVPAHCSAGSLRQVGETLLEVIYADVW
ncbi:MAG: M28 family peptidase, partial [Armatimonadota bacterium]